MPDKNGKTFRSKRGFSVIELLIVMGVVGILTAIAVPAMIAQRRVLRSISLGREIVAQMRLARQIAMGDRQSVTFEYNDTTKQIRIINHNNNHISDKGPVDPCITGRKEILVAAGFPDTQCAKVVGTYALTQGGLLAGDISYGIPIGSPPLPAGAPAFPAATAALGDTTVMTALAGGKLYITFQNDGSVVDSLGAPRDVAFFYFNNKAAQSTASAISVVGASGRVKVWRYKLNGNSYAE